MSNSKMVDYIKPSPACSKPRNRKITKITIHHMAGNLSVERCGDVFQNRQASSNYGIGTDGRVGMYVEEKDRAWTSSNAVNDNEAVTIEVANSGGAPDWPVSTKAFETLIELCVDICKRNGIRELKWTGSKDGTLTCHYMFASTACPGPFLKKRMPEIAEEVNKRLGKAETKKTKTKVDANMDSKIWEFLKNKGCCDVATAGIMGNIKAESNLNPKNLQNSFEKRLGSDESYTAAVDSGTYTSFVNDGAGYGLCQWTFHTRKKALLDLARKKGGSIGDAELQLEFMWKELTANKTLMEELEQCQTVREASDIILKKYERPADQGASAQKKRADYGQEFFDKFATKTKVPYIVKVTADALNIRTGAGESYAKAGAITDKGKYTIVVEKDGWGKLKSGAGWISLRYAKRV